MPDNVKEVTLLQSLFINIEDELFRLNDSVGELELLESKIHVEPTIDCKDDSNSGQIIKHDTISEKLYNDLISLRGLNQRLENSISHLRTII